jgi:hypothetical protein
MKQEEFMSMVDGEIKNVIRNINFSRRIQVLDVNLQTVQPWPRMVKERSIQIKIPTKSTTSKGALDALNASRDIILEAAEKLREGDAAYMESPEGRQESEKLAVRKIREGREKVAIALAESTGRLFDEHGGMYSRGDHHKINVIDIVDDPLRLRKLHASGKILALVEQERVRVYAKSSKWGPSSRADKFLVGTNENGIPFAHAVANTVTDVEDALRWIWDVKDLESVVDRHGDVAVITIGKQFVSPGQFGEVSVIDSHVFSGEFKKNGALFVRNGVLRHLKEQHPDVKIGNEWVRLKAANRSERRVATGSRD